MNANEDLTGIIQQKNKKIFFYKNGYKFTFMNEEIDRSASEIELISDQEDTFITGYTHKGNKILIYTGMHDVRVYKSFNTSSYIISRGNLNANCTCFDGITFVGGTLNKLFFQKSLKHKRNDSKGMYISFNDDSLKYSFTIENNLNINLLIRSNIIETSSIESGESLKNSGVTLTLLFDKPQPMKSVYKHYYCLMEIMSFMCFRECVGFEEIHILHKNSNYPDNYDETYYLNISNERILTEKNIMYNIHFENLKDSLIKLYQLFYRLDKSSVEYSLGFYPKSDKDINMTDLNMIRNVCSGLECEINFKEDIKSPKDEEKQKLINDIKEIIKKHRMSESALESKTYDQMLGSMKNWGLSNSDKIIALYHKYETEMEILTELINCIYINDIHITDQLIEEFIKFRNDITHGRLKPITLNIAITTRILAGLVYISLLDRVGVDYEVRKYLCENKQIIF